MKKFYFLIFLPLFAWSDQYGAYLSDEGLIYGSGGSSFFGGIIALIVLIGTLGGLLWALKQPKEKNETMFNYLFMKLILLSPFILFGYPIIKLYFF